MWRFIVHVFCLQAALPLLDWWCAGLLVLGALAPAYGASTLDLQMAQGKVELNGHLHFFKDDSAKLNLDSVRAATTSQRFIPNSANIANFGFSNAAYWFHVRLKNKDASQGEWFLENQYPALDYYDLYLVYPDQRVQVMRSGDRLPFSARGVRHRNMIHQVKLQAGESVDARWAVAPGWCWCYRTWYRGQHRPDRIPYTARLSFSTVYPLSSLGGLLNLIIARVQLSPLPWACSCAFSINSSEAWRGAFMAMARANSLSLK